MQPLDLDAQLGAELGVEVGRAARRTGRRRRRAPAPGRWRRAAAGRRTAATACGRAAARSAGSRRCARSASRSRPWAARGVLRPKVRLPRTRHLRIERVGLEHHADAAVLRLLPGDVLAVDEDLPVGDVEQAGDAVEQRGLAAAGRAEQDQELAVLDVEIEVLEHRRAAEAQREVADRDAGPPFAPGRFPDACPLCRSPGRLLGPGAGEERDQRADARYAAHRFTPSPRRRRCRGRTACRTRSRRRAAPGRSGWWRPC